MALRPVRTTDKAKRAIKGKDDSKKLISNREIAIPKSGQISFMITRCSSLYADIFVA